jgi:hypothetical protein
VRSGLDFVIPFATRSASRLVKNRRTPDDPENLLPEVGQIIDSTTRFDATRALAASASGVLRRETTDAMWLSVVANDGSVAPIITPPRPANVSAPGPGVVNIC